MTILSVAFDTVTKAVAAAGAVAVTYAFVTKNVDKVLPTLLTVAGLTYEAFLALLGLLVVAMDAFYWRGPVARRPSYAYRVALTRRAEVKIPTDWEIAERSRRRDQILTVAFGVLTSVFFGGIAYLLVRDDLGDGFPVRSPSVTWFLGCLALGVIAFMAEHWLLSLLTGERVPRSKQRCPSCGELCPKQAHVCSHCKEWFPAWKLQSPSPPPGP